MLPASVRITSCARLTQAFARLNIRASRGYAVAAKPSNETTKAKKAPAAAKVDKSQLPPKKPLSAFSKFIIEHKDSIPWKGENPFGVLSVKWREMSTAEKKKYTTTTEEWEQYHEQVIHWKENVDPVVLKEINKARRKKGLKNIRTVKRTPNSYALFLGEYWALKKTQQLEEGQERQAAMAIGQEAAVKWRSMSDAEKQQYKDKAATLKEERQKNEGKTEQVQSEDPIST